MRKGELLSEIREEFKRHTHVLAEQFHSELRTVAEQQGSVAGEIAGLRIDVIELKRDMAIIKPAVKEHSATLKEIKSELNNVKLAIKDVDVRLGGRIEDHEKRLK